MEPGRRRHYGCQWWCEKSVGRGTGRQRWSSVLLRERAEIDETKGALGPIKSGCIHEAHWHFSSCILTLIYLHSSLLILPLTPTWINGATNDPPKRIPCPVIKPVVELVKSFFCQEAGRTVVEVPEGEMKARGEALLWRAKSFNSAWE